MLPLVFTPLVDNSFISMGNARLPLQLHAASLAINICLTPLFIFGADLGIAGAALASNLSRGLTTGVGIYCLAREVELNWADIRPGTQLRRIFRVGWPITVGIATYSLVYWAVLWTSISPLGPQENAALGIGFSALEGFTWPCFHGLAMACASFVGRYLGAGRPDLARATLRLAMPVATCLGTIATLTFFLGGEFLTGLFTSDPSVHKAATRYAVILAASQIFVAWESLFEGVLTGAGATRIVFWLSLPLNALRIPLAWFLAFPLGWKAAGIWWAINASTVLKAAAKGVVVYRGGWEDTEV
jgi:MATE family multidrug resistance protein